MERKRDNLIARILPPTVVIYYKLLLCICISGYGYFFVKCNITANFLLLMYGGMKKKMSLNLHYIEEDDIVTVSDACMEKKRCPCVKQKLQGDCHIVKLSGKSVFVC